MAQGFQTEAVAGGDEDGLGKFFLGDGEDVAVDAVDFVEGDQAGAGGQGHLLQNGGDGVDVALPGGMRKIDDVEQGVGFGDFFQGGAEGVGQGGGQFVDEADGVGEDDGAGNLGFGVGDGEAATGGVEGGEELVGGVDGGVGEDIEQGGFARVGVADDGDGGHFLLLPSQAQARSMGL